MIQEKLRKYARVRRQAGLLETLRRVLRALQSRLTRPIYVRHRDLILVKDLKKVHALPSRDGIAVRQLEVVDGDLLSQFNREHRDVRAKERMVRYLRSGYQGFIGTLDDALIGYFWWVDRRTSHPHLTRYDIRLKDDEVYGFDFFVGEAFRGRGTSNEFLSKIESELEKLGYSRLWGWVAAGNAPARWLYVMQRHEIVKPVVSQEWFSRILVTDGMLFLKDRKSGLETRMVYPRTRRPAAEVR